MDYLGQKKTVQNIATIPDGQTVKNNAIVACEVKISVTRRSFEDIQALIERLREACTDDYKLEINFCGEFFKT